jgi:hypothetical protein
MTIDYASSASGTWGMRPKPVAVIGTLTVTATPSVSATTGTAPTGTRVAAVTNASSAIKGAAGKVFGFTVSNWGASAAWFNIYNIVTATVGTTNPLVQVLVPAGQTIDFEPPFGINFGTGIAIAATDISAVLSAVAPATPLVATVIWL